MSNLELSIPMAQTVQTASLEQRLRKALASRQLPHQLETELQSLTFHQKLSRIENMLLDILHDAVAEGYIRRV